MVLEDKGIMELIAEAYEKSDFSKPVVLFMSPFDNLPCSKVEYEFQVLLSKLGIHYERN